MCDAYYEPRVTQLEEIQKFLATASDASHDMSCASRKCEEIKSVQLQPQSHHPLKVMCRARLFYKIINHEIIWVIGLYWLTQRKH